jgi:hypothetical protein
MLSLYASQQISLVDGSITRQYTVFKDDQDKNTFYVLPLTPSFMMDNGKPRFKFIKYRSDSPDPKSKGGFCVFSVDLNYDKLNTDNNLKAKAAQQLLSPDSPIVKAMKQQAENTLAMCIAKVDNSDQTNYEGLRKNLGYSPAQAEALAQEYKDRKKTTAKDFEILPDDSAIKFSPVTFTASTANLNISELSNKDLVQKVINPASPSLLGNHATVFTVELTKEGAALFEQAMKEGQSGIVTVNYTPQFESRLPPATVTVTYTSTNTVKFTQDVSRDTWGNKDKIDKKREDFLKDNGKVDVDTGSIVGLSTAEIEQLKKRLQDWGNLQMQDILNSKLTVNTTSLTDGADKLDHFKNELSAINDFTRVWSESTSIIYAPGSLSMQLPSIKSIIAKDDSLNNYFVEINTDDTFFKDQEIRVSINTDWVKLGIFSVDVKLYYGVDMIAIKQDIDSGKISRGADGVLKNFDPTRYNLNPKEVSFNKDSSTASPELRTWPKVAPSNAKNNPINTYIYSYQIAYQGSTLKYQSSCYYTDDQVLTLGVVDEVLQVRADAKNLVNWDIVQSVRFDIDYEDQANNVRQQYFYQLDGTNTSQFVPKPIGAKRTQSVNYKSTFYLKTGQQITVPSTGWTAVNQTGEIVIPIDDPFSGMTTYTFIPKMGNIIDFIGISANYAITQLNFQMTKDFTFSKVDNQTWLVPMVLNTSGAKEGSLTYKGKMRDQGQMKDISGDDGGSNFVSIGPDNILVVEFSPTKIDFTKYDAVSLYVKYKAQEGSYDFTSANDPAYKFSAVVDQPNDKCQYRLELLETASGKTIYLPGRSANDWTENQKSKVSLFLDIKTAVSKGGGQ